jgi:N-acetylmuramic acid 6-phosphate etherase
MDNDDGALADTAAFLTRVNKEDSTVASAVRAEIPAIARAAEALATALDAGGRIYYLGAGTSGRLAVLDASELPPTFGVAPEEVTALLAGGREALFEAREGAEDDAEAAARELTSRGLTAKDAVVGIAASGATPYVLGGLTFARKKGARTACVVCEKGSPIAAAVELPIVVVTGPEVLTGSTRLKAGTAQKLVLNMLSTAVYRRRGLVYEGEMVAMRPTNEKLRRRAVRIVKTLAGVGDAEARALLERAAWNLPEALVAGKLRVTLDEARGRLARVRGNVAKALETPSTPDSNRSRGTP